MGTTCPVISPTKLWKGTHARKNSSRPPAMPCWNCSGSENWGASQLGHSARRTSVIVENRLSSSAGFLPTSAGKLQATYMLTRRRPGVYGRGTWFWL